MRASGCVHGEMAVFVRQKNESLHFLWDIVGECLGRLPVFAKKDDAKQSLSERLKYILEDTLEDYLLHQSAKDAKDEPEDATSTACDGENVREERELFEQILIEQNARSSSSDDHAGTEGQEDTEQKSGPLGALNVFPFLRLRSVIRNV